MKESFKQLIQKFVKGECTPEEVGRLAAYFENADKDDEFPEVGELLSILEEVPELEEEEADEIYQRILKNIRTGEANTTRSLTLLEKHKRKNFKRYAALAAVFIGIIGGILYFKVLQPNFEKGEEPAVSSTEKAIRLETSSGEVKTLSPKSSLNLKNNKGQIIGSQKDSLLTYENSKQDAQTDPEEIKYNTLKVPYGKRFHIELADGSTVYMNSGSSLKYPVRFPKKGQREVKLTGEAFFDVAKDADRPFIVESENLKVNVLGTQFNMSAYAEDNATGVALVEGSVNLSTTRTKADSTTLEPGQLGQYRKTEDGGLSVENVDTNIYTAWMDGGLVFRDMSFGNILKKLERHYDVTITNKDTTLAKEAFNANFGDEDLDTVLNYFKEVYGLDYHHKTEDKIIIETTSNK